jgi:hypothetical protein
MSSGSVLALDAAATGLAIPKLAVYEPPFVVDDSRPPLPDDYLQRLGALLADGRRGDAVELFLTTVVGVPAEFVAGMRSAPFWTGMEEVAHTLAYDAALMAGTMSGSSLPEHRWSRLSASTLVVDGGASPPWIHAAARALVRTLAASHVTLEGQDHDVAPAAVAPILRDFFAA